MKNPQTLAEELYKHFPTPALKSIRDYACCAFTLMWCLGIEPDDTHAIITVSDMIKAGVLDVDCTVYWQPAVEYLTGRKVTVEFVNITDIKKIKDRTPVRYVYKGKSHWIGVENGKIAFNSLTYSNCVENGKPDTMRVLKFTGGKA